jgi:hypothetical protein
MPFGFGLYQSLRAKTGVLAEVGDDHVSRFAALGDTGVQQYGIRDQPDEVALPTGIEPVFQP